MTKVQLKAKATQVANELVEAKFRRLLKEKVRAPIPQGVFVNLKRETRDALLAFRDVE